MELPKRTYTMEEAVAELHISHEMLERLIPNLPNSSARRGEPITEDELNQIVDMLNEPAHAASQSTADNTK